MTPTNFILVFLFILIILIIICVAAFTSYKCYPSPTPVCPVKTPPWCGSCSVQAPKVTPRQINLVPSKQKIVTPTPKIPFQIPKQTIQGTTKDSGRRKRPPPREETTEYSVVYF